VTSLATLDGELAAARDGARRLEKARRDLDAARHALEVETAKVTELARRLALEERDVLLLEGGRLRAWLLDVAGAPGRMWRDKERREAAAAKLRHDAAAQVAASLTGEIAHLEAEITSLGDPDARLAAALDAKERALMSGGDALARDLLAVATRRAYAEADRRELTEAIDAGEDVLADLGVLLEALNRAGNIGTWDLLGGGLFVTMVKHGYIDDARYVAAVLQEKLLRFDRELADVASGTLPTADLDIAGGLEFLDFFLDGLIVDWIVQSRITSARKGAEDTYAYVDQMVTWLHGLRAEADTNVATALAARAALLGAA
jgi:hypothetical protein